MHSKDVTFFKDFFLKSVEILKTSMILKLMILNFNLKYDHYTFFPSYDLTILVI